MTYETDRASCSPMIFKQSFVRCRTKSSRLLAARKADAEQRVDQTKAILIFGTILGLLITAAAGWSVWRDGSRRGRAEEALQDSQERYRMLLDEVRDHAIIMMDPQGRIVTWNAGAGNNIQGYSADEIIGQDFSCFYLPEDIARGRPQEILRRLLPAAASKNMACACEKTARDFRRASSSRPCTVRREICGGFPVFAAISARARSSSEISRAAGSST